MSNSNEFHIDLKITGNGQQQLSLYVKAFDSLRTAINNLSRPITNLDGDINKLTTALDKSKEKNIYQFKIP